MNNLKSPHSFHIPVMGTGFTIDTPLLVAKYGISSVISLVDDVLIEQMRKYWSEQYGEPYTCITASDDDHRAKRITSYLNLLQKLITQQVLKIKRGEFTENSETTKYFKLLPDDHAASRVYRDMLQEKSLEKKLDLQQQLRQFIVAGSIDVNIMTKLDVPHQRNGQALPYIYSDAAAALRGYANSELNSTIVLSAGFNPHLYGYISEFADFFPDLENRIKKKICLKVSDYRSAMIQGKYLAKRGIWVSEYRIESSVNCGGHAFINDGQLLGPILEEFKINREQLIRELHEVYRQALEKLKNIDLTTPQEIAITAQGGVGTNQEHSFLIRRYQLDSIGWGSPFLLVPEVTNVDDQTLQKLVNADENGVYLSPSSPLGVPFWNLKNSPGEELRRERIEQGMPGSPCPKGYIRFNRDFTELPICLASRKYQQMKLAQLEQSELSDEQRQTLKESVLAKSCICHELGGGVSGKRAIDSKVATAVCPGPNIINFKKIASLREMTNHIYGRCSLLINKERPHLFIKELQLQLANLIKEATPLAGVLPTKSHQKLIEMKKNLNDGIEYYRSLAKELFKEQQESFLEALKNLKNELDNILLDQEMVLVS